MRKQKTTKKTAKPKTAKKTAKPKTGPNPILAFRVDAAVLDKFVAKCGGLPEAQNTLRSFMGSV